MAGAYSPCSVQPGFRWFNRFAVAGVACGRHACHVVVKAAHALSAPASRDLQELAALPYSFITMWLAVHGAGLTRQNAPGRKTWRGRRTRDVGVANAIGVGRECYGNRQACCL